MALLVAEKLKNFGSEILIADPFVPDRDIIDSGYVPVALETLLKEVDIVSLHTRVNKDTIHMIGAEQLSLMKPNAYLINTSRAALVDTQALYQALKDKVILGAAIDVYDEEPIDGSHPLLSLDNVTCTNHRGGDTVESYINSPRMVLKEVNRYLNGERPRFWANAGNLPKMIFKEKK
jgi:D-3-phosphoglycerate dehydrogenase